MHILSSRILLNEDVFSHQEAIKMPIELERNKRSTPFTKHCAVRIESCMKFNLRNGMKAYRYKSRCTDSTTEIMKGIIDVHQIDTEKSI